MSWRPLTLHNSRVTPPDRMVVVNHFLLVYRQRTGELLELLPFGEDRGGAMRARWDREISQSGHDGVEVVVLSAESEEALRRTHARYFNSVQELAKRAVG